MNCERVFAEAFEPANQKVIRFLLSKGCSSQEAEDFSQRAWLNAWAKREQFRGECSLSTWVMRIALNLLLSEWRKAKHTHVDESVISLIGAKPRHDLKILVAQLLGLMDPQTRSLLSERYLEGKMHPRATVFRAVRKARGQIGRRASLLAAARAAGIGAQ